ncbi:exosortase/archaeosortase family protein [Candidatus Microgenomates bacterium]|nr:exosortase/archaeosortase family protein [Candidatus Microgenomates bacterium]
MRQKETFKILLAAFAVLMVLLPIFAALNSFLTESLNHAGWYRPIQDYVVPWEARLVTAAVSLFGVPAKVTPNSTLAALYMVKDGAAIPVDLAWNCLGWQSALLLIVSLGMGLRGNFSNFSRLKCIALGLLGTLLVNIFRMTIIAMGIYYVNSVAAQIVHDYFAAFLTIIWLVFFWWFSYSFILEEKQPSAKNNT